MRPMWWVHPSMLTWRKTPALLHLPTPERYRTLHLYLGSMIVCPCIFCRLNTLLKRARNINTFHGRWNVQWNSSGDKMGVWSISMQSVYIIIIYRQNYIFLLYISFLSLIHLINLTSSFTHIWLHVEGSFQIHDIILNQAFQSSL